MSLNTTTTPGLKKEGMTLTNKFYIGNIHVNYSMIFFVKLIDLGLSVVHLISATLYWWAWQGKQDFFFVTDYFDLQSKN